MNLAFCLFEPSLSGLEIGSSEWHAQQLNLIRSRLLTRQTYDLWYSTLFQDVATVETNSAASILEIGSGAGYVKTINPSVITSDVVGGASDLVIDAQHIPFGDKSLRAILLTHVFHHIPDVQLFLREAERTLIPGGIIAIIDVAHTPLSRFLFDRFHPEDYNSRAADWRLDPDRPIGGANQALSWIVLVRDRALFETLFPNLEIETLSFLPWLAYLFSGGVTKRNIIPNFLAKLISKVDGLTRPIDRFFALHWHIRLRKKS